MQATFQGNPKANVGDNYSPEVVRAEITQESRMCHAVSYWH
jgi:hypothetical protein